MGTKVFFFLFNKSSQFFSNKTDPPHYFSKQEVWIFAFQVLSQDLDQGLLEQFPSAKCRINFFLFYLV
jgi:hypothetical protein